MSKPRKKKPPEGDRSLIEVSNDSGDHWVADVPTEGVTETEKSLKKAGAVPDKDEDLRKRYDAARVVDNRDSEEYRYRSARAVDEEEDTEDTYDREEDRSDEEPHSDDEPDSDSERSEQSPGWKFW